MAQSPKSRRSRSSRKPVTLDLQAEKVEPETATPDAEPVAFGRSGPEEAQPASTGTDAPEPESKVEATPADAGEAPSSVEPEHTDGACAQSQTKETGVRPGTRERQPWSPAELPVVWSP